MYHRIGREHPSDRVLCPGPHPVVQPKAAAPPPPAEESKETGKEVEPGQAAVRQRCRFVTELVGGGLGAARRGLLLILHSCMRDGPNSGQLQ